MIWFWLLPLIPLTAGLIYIEGLKEFLEQRGLLRLGLQRSELEKKNLIRGILLLLIVFFVILTSGRGQLIVGMIGILLGFAIMYYSEPIHRLFAQAGAPSIFRGDAKVKLIGLLMCILSAGWMSGITQDILYGFLSTANLIPSPDTVEYYR